MSKPVARMRGYTLTDSATTIVKQSKRIPLFLLERVSNYTGPKGESSVRQFFVSDSAEKLGPAFETYLAAQEEFRRLEKVSRDAA
jgi:hypothetical protein